MSDTLEFFEDDTRAGFRLHRAEVYNWGTFHGRVWTLNAQGRNTLLTGDIGSGKSTFVDAITTLLVPTQKIVYNKAAGAEGRERNLRSYLMGSYKAERGDEGGSRAVGLRDAHSYSVILAHFRNEGYAADVTLAQVFWFRDPAQPPVRFHVVADRVLSIAKDFSGFGSDVADLKKRLKATGATEIHETFKDYQDGFRRRFGIENPQALELFHQTVSMKAVGNLTEFVRDHMLEPFEAQDRVARLLTHFEDLNRAHEAVLKAKDQIARLTPLIDDCDRFADAVEAVSQLKLDREALRPWFAGLKADLLVKRLDILDREARRRSQRRATLEEQRADSLRSRDELMQAIAENGGQQLLRLDSEVGLLAAERDRRKERAERYAAAAVQAGLADVEDGEGFLRNHTRLQELKNEWKARESALEVQRGDDEGAFRDQRRELAQVAEELESLRSRPSNLPREQIEVRRRLCADLGLTEDQLSFAGELMAVREEFSSWEGAAERVLRSFALSLLVPDEWYAAVSSWVDKTNLAGRLVYFRVRPVEARRIDLQDDSLVERILLKSDSPHRDWLRAELARRFDLVCCDDLDRFRRERQALTQSGQVKGGERHEKDDRHRIDDRTRYVLGWSNRAKLAALEAQTKKLQTQLGDLGTRVAAVRSELAAIQDRLQGAAVLSGFPEFLDLDWRSTARHLADKQAEREALRRSSDRLVTLRTQLATVEASLAAVSRFWDELAREEGQGAEKQAVAQAALEEARRVHAEGAALRDSYVRLEAGYSKHLGSTPLTVEATENRQSEYRQILQGLIDSEDRRVARLREKIVQVMKDYQTTYRAETREIDASPEAAGAYREILSSLVGDDLPRFEKEFKKLLNENTIREVANFQFHLHRDQQTIKERIELINQSLTQIDYNRGRYIKLEVDRTGDAEIRGFQQELRACTEGSLTGITDDQYSEVKYLQVRAILERFRGRNGLEELDRRWTEKVTDVRQAFVFSASERWREDDREHEHYTDSAGKSGGQKEKLAYTVLAASLAYQFGLEWGAVRSRTFRFVAIDEAFGRGSDESTRYGLSLFRKLNLQLLLITPLQKIPVIEPYVSSVGFVSNDDGRDSKLCNLSIEEYQTERAARGSSS